VVHLDANCHPGHNIVFQTPENSILADKLAEQGLSVKKIGVAERMVTNADTCQLRNTREKLTLLLFILALCLFQYMKSGFHCYNIS
jgi:hypothetical protein